MSVMFDVNEPGVVSSSPCGLGVEGMIDDLALEQMMSAASERGVALTGEGGFLPELIKSVLERGGSAVGLVDTWLASRVWGKGKDVDYAEVVF